jgi:hypothetical protein
MSDVPILGHDDESHTLKRFMAQYDVPAYVRRARRVQEAWDSLISRCQRQREEWLPMVRLRLGRLRALAGDWERLRPWLAGDEQIDALQQLEGSLQPKLRAPLEPTTSARVLRVAFSELIESIEHFNRRWQPYLQSIDLAEVNDLRDGYNRFFLLEKECAFRSARMARQGFRRLEPATLEELTTLLPPLPVLQWKP